MSSTERTQRRGMNTYMKAYEEDDFDGAPVATIERWRWSSHKKFMMQAVGANEGLTSIFWFPIYVAKHGNGAFLIPYLLFKIFFVIPITYMQLALGQYSEKGPLDVWVLCPLAQGIGYTMIILGWYVLVLNNTVMSFSLYYLFSSFQSELPWSHCDHDWANERCMVRSKNATTIATCLEKHNYTVCRNFKWETSAEHFWLVHVRGNIPGEDILNSGLGYFKVGLVICLFLSCFVVFIATAKGLKNMEKIVNITTIYPFVGTSALLFATFLDPGASLGLGFFLRGKFSTLNDYQVWVRAYQVCLHSLGLSFGVLITMGSYCTFRSPTNMDAITLNLIDIVTSLACGVFCFNCLGIIGYHYGIQPRAVLVTGSNLPFVIVPEALAFIPGSTNFWSLVYFSTIFCFGITTQYFIMASNLSVIYDRFPNTMQYSVFVSGGASLLLFLLGLPLCTTNGTAFIRMMDIFISGAFQATVLCIQLFIVLWIYALGRFSDDVHFMLGFRPSSFYQGCWLFAPLVSFIYLFYEYKNTMYQLETENVNLSLICWWLIYNVPIGFVVGMAVVQLVVHIRQKKLRLVLKAVPEWGPVDPVLIKSRRMFSAQAMTKEYMYRQSRLGAHARNTMQSGAEHDDDQD